MATNGGATDLKEVELKKKNPLGVELEEENPLPPEPKGANAGRDDALKVSFWANVGCVEYFLLQIT